LWRPIPWLSLYGSYTENFGAANSLYNTDGKYLPPQTAQQWEAGVKTELLDGRLSATLSYFDLTKQNIAVTDYSTPTPLTQTIGEAKTRGLEFDVVGQVLPGWQVIGTYTFMPFAEVTKDVGSNGGIGNQGKRLFQAPRHTASIWNTYEFQGGEIRGLKLGAGVVAVGQREGNLANTYQLPGYAIVNLLASYPIKMGQNKITAQLNVDNLADKTYYVGSNSGNFITFGAPRTVTVSIKADF
jgi:iron complex outermembrane receptor protein